MWNFFQSMWRISRNFTWFGRNLTWFDQCPKIHTITPLAPRYSLMKVSLCLQSDILMVFLVLSGAIAGKHGDECLLKLHILWKFFTWFAKISHGSRVCKIRSPETFGGSDAYSGSKCDVKESNHVLFAGNSRQSVWKVCEIVVKVCEKVCEISSKCVKFHVKFLNGSDSFTSTI